MKYLPFKTIIACILFPPLFYVATLNFAELYLTERYTDKIDPIYKGDVSELLEGNITLRQSINSNIEKFLKNDPFIFLGGKISITVFTMDGRVLYPSLEFISPEDIHSESPMDIAAENYRLLSEVKLQVHINIAHNTLISNLILLSYLGIFSILLYFQYQNSLKHMDSEEISRKKEIDRLTQSEKEKMEDIDRLWDTKNKLEKDIVKAVKDEEFLFHEIESLEKRIGQGQNLQKDLLEKIEALNSKIEHLEKNGKNNKRNSKRSETTRKRFQTLYKNTVLHDRALSGFMALSDEMKLKGEELIHRINETPESVTIKRKVFGQKNRETILEVLFGYKGRLYFKKSQDNKAEILAIGTKNSQLKDLEYINNLKS